MHAIMESRIPIPREGAKRGRQRGRGRGCGVGQGQGQRQACGRGRGQGQARKWARVRGGEDDDYML